jgi:hypothetical protein
MLLGNIHSGISGIIEPQDCEIIPILKAWVVKKVKTIAATQTAGF